jgi:hypothetical protein
MEPFTVEMSHWESPQMKVPLSQSLLRGAVAHFGSFLHAEHKRYKVSDMHRLCPVHFLAYSHTSHTNLQVKLWKQRGTKNADRGPTGCRSYLSFATPSKLKTNQVAWQLETSVKQWESMRLTMSCSLAISLRQRDVSHLLALSDSIPFVNPIFFGSNDPNDPNPHQDAPGIRLII